MAIKETNLVLNLPFNEAAGSAKAYDYSKSRADGVLAGGANFVAGKQGNCVEFDGTGKVSVEASVLNLSKPFSICAYVWAEEGKNIFTVVLNYAGQNQYYEYKVGIVPGTWFYLVLTYESSTLCIYLNGTLIQRAVVNSSWGAPVGVSVNNVLYNTELAEGKLDEVKLYQQAFTQDEVQDLLDDTRQLAYKLDGVNFKDYGVYVSASKGLLDGLKMKEPNKVEFDGYHGTAVDLSRPRFEERSITLECFMHVKGGKMAFVQAVKTFVEQFHAKHVAPASGMESSVCPAGLHRLTVDIHPTKPLLYEVYLPDGMEVDKTWNDSKMVGTFSLKLTEPEPVKKVIKHLRVSEETKRLTITLTTTKLVNIYWGDGTQMQDVYGTNVTITHDYAEDGDYFAIITGVIEDVTNVDTNGIIVWDKL
jgi:hypothetical protein